MGILKRAISADASVVAMAVDTTDIVSEIEIVGYVNLKVFNKVVV